MSTHSPDEFWQWFLAVRGSPNISLSSDQFWQWFLGVCGLPHGFRLYDQVSSNLLTEVSIEDRSFDLSSLSLNEGTHTLGLSAVNAYGTESDVIEVVLATTAGGAVAEDVRAPIDVTLAASTGGVLIGTWRVEPHHIGAVDPDRYELAYDSDLSTILATVDHDRQTARYRRQLPALSHLETRILAVRSASAGGITSRWVTSQPIAADAEGPPAAVAVPTPHCCC